MQAETFFSHKKYRWLWSNLSVLAVLIVAYILHSPAGGASGRTNYGYTVGALATAAILYLMWYGMRKRSYHSSNTTLKGWLSAHVWLGISLLFMVPLHSGFHLKMNIHGLAYILMVVVILSGIWGALNYKNLAPQIASHRGGGSLKSLIEQIHIYSANISTLCIGKSDRFLNLRNQIEVMMPKTLFQLLYRTVPRGIDDRKVADMLAHLPEEEKNEGLNLVQLCEKKRNLTHSVQKEVRISAKLKFWLLIHLPISFALIVAVAIHIFSVLFYR